MTALRAAQSPSENQDLAEKDKAALNPRASVFVSASAGSGKTTLLTKRVLRLLLEETGRQKKRLPHILCLTYTRAAAAQMQNKIHEYLARWATATDDGLRDELFTLFALAADKAMLKKARQLFSAVLETPEHVRILTMHAFCQMVLHRFPLEAGVAPHFTLLDGPALKAFQSQLLADFLEEMGGGALQKTFTAFAASQGAAQTKEDLHEVLKAQEKWAQFFEDEPDDEAYTEKLRLLLQLPKHFDAQDYLKQALEAPMLDEVQAQRAITALRNGSKKDMEKADYLAQFLAHEDRSAAFDTYKKVFFTDKGQGKLFDTFVTKSVSDKYPEVAAFMAKEALRIEAVVQRLQAHRYFIKQSSFIVLARALSQKWAVQKARVAALTFDDLVSKTRQVLRTPGIATWILYKLDNGLDHLLIDEAQDTAPAQWDIILALLDEFFAGAGARASAARTLFVVGDEKQSIYSFQGADRAGYLKVRENMFARLKAADKQVDDQPRGHSYRSGQKLLDMVDAVFKDEAARKGVAETPTKHIAARGTGGMVELWEPLYGEENEKPAPWTVPLTREDARPPAVELSNRIAATIATWIKGGFVRVDRSGEKHAITAKDILILVQRRSNLLMPIVRALKEAGVPVAGVDRMMLHEQAAVQDVLAFCRFLLLPQDDLCLAEVLRGPLIRLSDNDLFELAYARQGGLWEALQIKAQQNPCSVFGIAEEYLRRFLNKADQTPVFGLLCDIFYTPCPDNNVSGLKALTRRLGPDAVDPLEELLSFAIAFEMQRLGGLQRFVAAATQDEREIKRELSKPGDAVRILTAHGAKGLEAPIVFIPDLLRDPHKKGVHDKLCWDAAGRPFLAGAGVPEAVEALKQLKKERDSEEHRRLLYVALTRAEDVLILCGAGKKEKNTLLPWHAYVLKGMETLSVVPEQGAGGGRIWRYGAPAIFEDARSAPHGAGAPPMPAWLYAPAPKPAEKIKTINPSRLGDETEVHEGPQLGTKGVTALQRGTLIHKLLELLPRLAPTTWEERMLRYLRAQVPEEEARASAGEVLKLLQNPALQHLFGACSQGEVPIIGHYQGKRISGQIDRMVVRGDEVLVLDYKTNRPPPEREENVAPTYLAQMAAYHVLLKSIYPDKKLRCFLLWTHTCQAMELSALSIEKGMGILAAA